MLSIIVNINNSIMRRNKKNKNKPSGNTTAEIPAQSENTESQVEQEV